MATPHLDSDSFGVVAGRSPQYARELRGKNPNLSLSDCEDLVQDALEVAWSNGAHEGHSVEQLEAYVRTVLARRTTDHFRKAKGQGAVKRSHVAFDESIDLEAPDALTEDSVEAIERAALQSTLHAAFERLPAVNRDVIRDRYTLELSPAQCQEQRGINENAWARLFTLSLNRLRTVLEHTDASECLRTRVEFDIARASGVSDDAAARAFAHAHAQRDVCLSCTAYRMARTGKAGMLGALPVPAAGYFHRLLNRIPGAGGQADRIAAAAGGADAVAAAGAGTATAGAGGAVLLGISAQSAAVAGCSLVATGACIFGGTQLLAKDPVKQPVPKVSQVQVKPRARTISAATAAAPPVVLSASALARRTGQATIPATTAAPAKPAKKKTRKTKRATTPSLPQQTSTTRSTVPASTAPASSPVLPQSVPAASAPAAASAPVKPAPKPTIPDDFFP